MGVVMGVERVVEIVEEMDPVEKVDETEKGKTLTFSVETREGTMRN
jgi:hypothetical protein